MDEEWQNHGFSSFQKVHVNFTPYMLVLHSAWHQLIRMDREVARTV